MPYLGLRADGCLARTQLGRAMLFIGALFSVGHPELVELLDEGALRIHPKARGNAPKGSTKRFCYPTFLKVTIDRTFSIIQHHP